MKQRLRMAKGRFQICSMPFLYYHALACNILISHSQMLCFLDVVKFLLMTSQSLKVVHLPEQYQYALTSSKSNWYQEQVSDMQISNKHQYPHSLQIKEKMVYRETRQFNIFRELSDPHSNEALGLRFPTLRFSEATATVNFKSWALRPWVSYKRLLQGCMSQQEVWQ